MRSGRRLRTHYLDAVPIADATVNAGPVTTARGAINCRAVVRKPESLVLPMMIRLIFYH